MAKRIMAVDDSKTMRDMVAFALKSGGYEVLLAEDGKEALDMSGREKVDLVITDVNMPNMDGITLTSKLRASASYKSTPILILTTESDQSMKEKGRAAGATGWIVKPFTPDKLMQVVQKVCG